MLKLSSILVFLLLTFPTFVKNQTTGTPLPSPTLTPTPEPTPIEDTEILRIDTEEISLNVRVIDSRNRPVNNLDKTQFSVYENDVLQPITSFTTEEVPIISTLVIDNSRSLRSELAKIVEAGKILISTNGSKDKTSIVRFVSKEKIEILSDFTSNKNLLNYVLDNLFIEGGQTAVIDAVYQATTKIMQYENIQNKIDLRRRSLIVVSDGDDRGSLRQESELFELLRRSDVQIYTVGFVNNLNDELDLNEKISQKQKARTFLTQLAVITGGKAYFPESIEQLSQIAEDISSDLRTQYLITYLPTNENRDSRFYDIKVTVKDGPDKEKRIAITRSGRIVTSSKTP